MMLNTTAVTGYIDLLVLNASNNNNNLPNTAPDVNIESDQSDADQREPLSP